MIDRLFKAIGLTPKSPDTTLDLIATSHPDEIQVIYNRIAATQLRRAEREGKPIPDPQIEISDGDTPDQVKMIITYNNHTYLYFGERGHADPEGFAQHMKEYLPNAPSCITCDRVFFPGDLVAECNLGPMHTDMDCCPSALFLNGYVDREGRIVEFTPAELDDMLVENPPNDC